LKDIDLLATCCSWTEEFVRLTICVQLSSTVINLRDGNLNCASRMSFYRFLRLPRSPATIRLAYLTRSAWPSSIVWAIRDV